MLNPIGTVPLFMTITQNLKKEERKAVSKTAIITSGIVLVVFAIAGTGILRLFGITIFSFMIAGGVLLFIVAIEFKLLTHGVWRFGGGQFSLASCQSFRGNLFRLSNSEAKLGGLKH